MTRRFVLGLFLVLALGLAFSACGGGDEEAAPAETAPAETTPAETAPAETGAAETAPVEEQPASSGALDVNTLLATDLAACEPAPEGDPLVIGYAADLSEVGGFVDVPGSEAAQFMGDLINCAGGVNGTPVEVIIQDIQGDPEVTQRAAQDLLDAGAQVILGPPFADFGSPLLQVTKGQVPVLFVSSTEPLLPDIENLSFLTTTDDITQATTGAEFALDQGYQTAVTFSAPGPYFGTNPETFTEVFTAGGGEVLADYTYAPFEDTDFSTQVNELAGLPEVPNVLYTAMPMPQIATLIGQIEGAGIQIPEDMAVVGTDAFDATRIIDAPDAAEGVYYTTHAFPGEGTPMKAFLDKFEAETGSPLETVSFGALAADAVLVAADAFTRAGSLDPLAIGEAIKETDGLEVVTGTVGYTGTNGVPNKPVYIHQILDGEVTLAETRGGS